MLQGLLLALGANPALVSSIMVWVGLATIIGVLYLMIKQVETRLVLLGSGFLLCFLSIDPLSGFVAFEKGMVLTGFIKTILSVMGFAYVMKQTRCDTHLVNLMVSLLSRVRLIIIPGAVLITAFINIALPSAAGVVASVGVIMIPLMISLGVHPAVAASAVMAGTFGSQLSPGHPQNAFLSNMFNAPIIDVINWHVRADVVSICIGAIMLFVVALVRKEHTGYIPEDGPVSGQVEKPNLLYALVPVLPVLLLVLCAWFNSPAAPGFGKAFMAAAPWFKIYTSVPAAMLTGAILGIIVTRSCPTACVKEFFNGMGSGYAAILGLIISASVFVAGMHAVGLIEAGINAMKSATGVVRFATAFGPFALALITGSGDAATLAFQQAVTPHALDFGMTIENMGGMAMLSGSLGRAMSPLAGAAIISAGMARVHPLEITKRNAAGMITAAFVSMMILA